MKNVEKQQLEKLKKYIDTFNIRLSHISEEIGLDKSMVPKYFNGRANMSVSRYNEIIEILRVFADGDELKLYLIDNWLKIETTEDKRNTLKKLVKETKDLVLEIDDIIGE